MNEPNPQAELPILEDFLSYLIMYNGSDTDVSKAAKILKEELKVLYYREPMSGTVFTFKKTEWPEK